MDTNNRTAQGKKFEDLLNRVIMEVTQTPAFNRILVTVLNGLVGRWSRGSVVKKSIAGVIVKLLSNGLLEGSSQGKALGESDIWKDPEVIPTLVESIPLLADSLQPILKKIEENFRSLSPETRTQYVCDLVRGLGAGLTSQVKGINESVRHNPSCLKDSFEGPVKELIKSIDFGELKETVDNSQEAVISLINMINDLLWDYPAKGVCLFGLIPPVANIGVSAVHGIVRPLHNMSPDLLADVVFSLMRQVKGKELGALVNSLAEMLRKLHTGSVLLSESGMSRFYTDFKNLLYDIVSEVDPVLLFKARIALAEDAETISNAVSDVIIRDPELFTAGVSSYALQKNPAIRAKRKRLSIYENLPEEDVVDAMSSGTADLDTQEIGETINSFLRIINLIYEYKPEMIPSLVAGVVQVIDTDELEAAAQNVVRDLVRVLKPVSGVVIPPIINGLCRFLTPEPGEETSKLDEALSSLRKILVREGGTK